MSSVRGGAANTQPRARGREPATKPAGAVPRGGATRGRGGGRGRGQRPEHVPTLADHDVVSTRPEALPTKRGTSGRLTYLAANYFPLAKRPSWCLNHYRVDFKPEESLTHLKKQIMKPHLEALGPAMFDGHSLYTPNRLSKDPMRLNCNRPGSSRIVEVTIRLVGQVNQIDPMTLQFYNLVIRQCLEKLKLEELGRYFYDSTAKITLSTFRLELWPGFITSMRHHENQVLLCVEPVHKVLRMDSVLSIVKGHRRSTLSQDEYKKLVARDVIGQIVLTGYNKKTYRVDDIDWLVSPASTFGTSSEGKNGVKVESQTSYVAYYKERYGQLITDTEQPLLISRPSRKDTHRGQKGPIYLIPELCQMTGLTDGMRADNELMQQVSAHLHMAPTARFDRITEFMTSLQKSPEIKKELDQWGLKFGSKLVEVPGRVLDPEKIFLYGGVADTANEHGEWTESFQKQQMKASAVLKSWVVVAPTRDISAEKEIDQLIIAMRTTAGKIGFKINPPTKVYKLRDTNISDYMKAVTEAIKGFRGLEMVFVVLPNDKLDLYSAVKKKCFVDNSVASQCFLMKGIKSKSFGSIVSKLVIQMNTKLGGIPWEVDIPAKNMMILGFDVYHCANRKGNSVGALVASTGSNGGTYYSTVSFHTDKNELSSNLCGDITKALTAYEQVNNGHLPKRVILYRDGVGEGQLSFVYETELVQIQNAIKAIYTSKKTDLPKFSFIVVTKRINTRLFLSPTNGNPPPGTIADDVITLPERYDFFLVSQNAKQGTVSPTAYNVLYDQQGLSSDQLQRLTYKLCHLYYNCSNTVAVPASCQYAHKMAYLTGMALNSKGSEALANRLYYL